MLTDFLVALPEEAQAISAAGGKHWKQWPCVTLKNIDPVKLTSLWEQLSPGMASKEMCSGGSMLCEAESGESWVFSLPPEFVATLAVVGTDHLAEIGSRWADTEELVADSFSRDGAVQVVRDLSRIAKQAVEAKKPMLLWMSL